MLMKRMIYNWLTAILCMLPLLMTACQKENSSDTGDLVQPRSLFMPRDAYQMDLSKDRNIVFEWEQSMGGNVRYQVVFDSVDGDFSKPLYVVLSDNNGFKPTATVLPVSMSALARLAGCLPGGSVTVKWTVLTWMGTESKLGCLDGKTRNIVLLLPEDDIDMVDGEPLQISGSPEDGQYFSFIDSYYEIFTRLDTESAFAFDAANVTLGLDETGTAIKTLADEETSPYRAPEEGVYRITLDIKTRSASVAKVTEVRFKQNYHRTSVMTYAGQGSWKLEAYTLHWDSENWGLETRYHFDMEVGGTRMDWGCVINNDRPSRLDEKGTDYFWIKAYEPDDWQGSFKFPEYLVDQSYNERYSADILLHLNGSHYTHEFTNEEDHYVPPVVYEISLSGDAVEAAGTVMDPYLPLGGTDIAEDKYGLFRHFNAGSFQVKDNDKWYVLEGDGSVSESDTEVDALTVETAGEYEFVLDLGEMTWQMNKIDHMILYWHPFATSNASHDMTYAGKGVWTTGDFTFVAWMPTENRSDARYHFRLFYEDGRGEHWGRVDNKPYSNAYRFEWSIGEWDHVWKPLDGGNESDSISEGKTVEVKLHLNTVDGDSYYQEMIIKN